MSEVTLSQPETGIDRTIRTVMEVAVPSVAIVFSVIFFVSVGDLAPQSSLYPRIIAALVIVLALVTLFREVRSRISGGETPLDDDYETLNGSWAKLSFCVVATLLYAFLMGNVGFYISTGAYAFAVAAFLDRPSLLKPLAFGVAVSGVAYLCFRYLMQVPLPSGWLF